MAGDPEVVRAVGGAEVAKRLGIEKHRSDIILSLRYQEAPMAAITIRNLSDETHRALKVRAAAHGRSTEAEVRQILDDAVAADTGSGFGSRLAKVAAEVGGFDLDIQRDRTASEPIEFS